MNNASRDRRQSTFDRWALLAILAAVVAFPGHESNAQPGPRPDTAQQDRLPGGEPQVGVRDRGGELHILPHPARRWTLGVQVDNLPTGTRITNVVPSSPASRVGLERRDIIVAVNGFQVGIVRGQLFDLESELNLRADRQGVVRLLVWNQRNGELLNVDVALAAAGLPGPVPRQNAIQGTVTFRAVVPADQNAEVVVQLLDLTDRQRGGRLIAERRSPFTGKLPVEFSLDIDRTQLAPHRRYQLQAHLTVNGTRLLASEPGLYLLNQTDPRAINIELRPIRFDRR